MIRKSVVHMRLTGRDACMFDGGLSPRARIVYYALDFHCRWKGASFPGQKALAEEVGICVRLVKSAVAELQTSGYISVERHRRESATYRLKWADQEVHSAAPQEIKKCTEPNQEVQDLAFSGAPDLITEAGIEAGFESASGENKTTENPACPWCHGRGQRGTGADRSACGMCGGTGERHRRSA